MKKNNHLKNLPPASYDQPDTLIGCVFAPRESFAFHPQLAHSDCLLFVTGVEMSCGLNSQVYAETHHRFPVICRVHWLDTYFEQVCRLTPLKSS